MNCLPLVITLAVVAQGFGAGTGCCRADELSSTIDKYVEARLQTESVSPAPAIEDAAFARRVTLDLAGRIPTTNELRQFLAQNATNKRQAYVSQLLDSPDFALHLRNELDLMLLADLKHDAGWREYLLSATRENRSWDRLFREIMLPERESPEDKRPAAFLHARAKDLDSMTNDASVLFFGVNISCAKCHDHPLVADWHQQHYFGLASFFHRTYPTKSGLVGERFEGSLKFTTVYGEEKNASFMFLTGAEIAEPERQRDGKRKKKVDQQIRDAQRKSDAPPPPLPEFSPRAELVRLALGASQNRLLARNMVNRTWARLLGRGLVHPLDQMHSANASSHPALLDFLADDFVAHGYDLRHLICGIVLSRTYARSARATTTSEPPAAELFARAIVRPLTARQVALSLHIATSHPDRIGGLFAQQQWAPQRQQLEQQSGGVAELLTNPSDTFQVGTEEALFFSNSEQINALLDPAAERLVGHLAQIDDEARLIETAFQAALARSPAETERDAIALYLAQRPDHRTAAIQHIVWALLASPEFRFNH